MAAKPLTTETIALTEKKMDMTLEDIIKMSKGNGDKSKKQRRPANKSRSFLKTAVHEKIEKVRRYVDSRSSVRQGFLAKKRTNYQGNQFLLTTEVAQKAANAPFRGRSFGSGQGASRKPRTGASPMQQRPGNARFAAAKAAPHQGGVEMPRQRPQTLDSLFANMKEERMRALSRKNGAPSAQRNRPGAQRRPNWRRSRPAN